MLRVTVTLDQFGLGEHLEELASVTIVNDGTRSQETEGARGTYVARAYSKTGACIRTATVEDWPRKSRPVLALVTRCLEELGY